MVDASKAASRPEDPSTYQRPTGAGQGDPAGPTNGHGPAPAPTQALKDALEHLGELKAYATYYITAKIDSTKASLRNLVLYAALLVVAGIVGLTVLIVATVQLMAGLAQAIAAIFDPDQMWVGNLVVGLLVLAVVGIGAVWFMTYARRSARRQTIDKYEQMRKQQRLDFGRDVQDWVR